MKIQPRSLLAPKTLTLPSGLEVTVLGSPALDKLVRSGKLPMPLVQKAIEMEADVKDADADAVATAEQLSFGMEFQAALVVAVVKSVKYVDDDGNSYDLPMSIDSETDDHYPYELLSTEDADYLYTYAQEGVVPLATFPEDAGSTGSSEGSKDVRPKAKRTPRAKS
jgi:hypothetical protein